MHSCSRVFLFAAETHLHLFYLAESASVFLRDAEPSSNIRTLAGIRYGFVTSSLAHLSLSLAAPAIKLPANPAPSCCTLTMRWIRV